jgi:hypothetical protein
MSAAQPSMARLTRQIVSVVKLWPRADLPSTASCVEKPQTRAAVANLPSSPGFGAAIPARHGHDPSMIGPKRRRKAWLDQSLFDARCPASVPSSGSHGAIDMTTAKTVPAADAQRDKLVARYGRIGIAAVAAAAAPAIRRAAPSPARFIDAVD